MKKNTATNPNQPALGALQPVLPGGEAAWAWELSNRDTGNTHNCDYHCQFDGAVYCVDHVCASSVLGRAQLKNRFASGTYLFCNGRRKKNGFSDFEKRTVFRIFFEKIGFLEKNGF